MKTRNLIVLAVFILTVQNIFSITLSSRIDERIEFACLVSRYADIDNHSVDNYYYNFVDRNFWSKSSHSVFEYIYYCQQKYSFTRSMLLSAALTWEMDNGHIVQNATKTNPLKDQFSLSDYEELIRHLDSYYRHISFGEFFMTQQPLYQKAKKIYDENVLTGLHADFFQTVSSEPVDGIGFYVSLLGNMECVSLLESKSVIINSFRFVEVPTMTRDAFSPSGLMLNGLSGKDVIYPLLCSISKIILNDKMTDTGDSFSKTSVDYYKSAMLLFDKADICVGEVMLNQISQLAALLYVDVYHNDILNSSIVFDIKRGFIWENELYNRLKKLRTFGEGNNQKFESLILNVLYDLTMLVK